jgi:hypothetical protein
MSENFPPRPLYPEYASDVPENESAPLEQVRPIPGYPQPIMPFGLAPYNELVTRHQDPPEASPIPSERSLNPKVPIPRTTRPINYTSSGRVGRACENCREQKAKCSGHRPSCHRCQDAGIPCSYGDRKREKMLKCVGCVWREPLIVASNLENLGSWMSLPRRSIPTRPCY